MIQYFVFKAYKIIHQYQIIQYEQSTTGTIFTLANNLIYKKILITDCHGAFQSLRIKNTGRVRQFLERTSCRFSNLIVTVSEEKRKILIKYGISEEKKFYPMKLILITLMFKWMYLWSRVNVVCRTTVQLFLSEIWNMLQI